MSAPDESTTTAPRISDPATWTEADIQAAMESAYWFDMNATPELVAPYGGMHVAIFGKQIIAADPDRDTLYRRVDAMGDAVPTARLILRYVPTEEEALRYRY